MVYLPRGDAHPTIDLVVGWRTDGPENVIAQTLTRLHALVAMG